MVSAWIKVKANTEAADGNEKAAHTADGYDFVVLSNRRKQLEFRQRSREAAAAPDPGAKPEGLRPEDMLYSTHRLQGVQTATGLTFTFSSIEDVVKKAPVESWLGLNLQYKLERRLLPARLGDIVASLLESPEPLTGEVCSGYTE